MPRTCVLCGKGQNQSTTVFSFPSSPKQREAWVKVILEAKPDLLTDKKFIQSSRLKNGLCELHFLRSEISRGKKRRLGKGTIPCCNIPISPKCNAIMNSYKSVFSKSSPTIDSQLGFNPICSIKGKDSNFDAIPTSEKSNGKELNFIPECTIKIEIEEHSTSSTVRQSMVDNIFEKLDDEICLCCGLQTSVTGLSSVLKVEDSKGKRAILEELSDIFDVPKERVIGFSSYLCRKCLKMFQDLLELRNNFISLLSHLKEKFLLTSKNLSTGNKIQSCLEINNDKSHIKNNPEDLSPLLSPVRRKSNRLENNETKFKCDQCNKWVESISTLSSHKCICHEAENTPNSFPSTINEQISIIQTDPIQPCPKDAPLSRVNIPKQTFECPCCRRYITSKARLDRHMFKFHGVGKEKEKAFQCKLCERRFTSKPGLRYHQWTFHKMGKTYNCEICHKHFPFRMLYNSHKLFAHGKKNIVCEYCGEMFFTVSKLNVHVNAIHKNALTWLCKQCHEKFTTASAYRHHVVVKHKRTLFNCSHCSLQFKRKYSLRQHLSRNNIFICPKCNHTSSSPPEFAQHMAEIHKMDATDSILMKLNRNRGMKESSSTLSIESTTAPMAVPSSGEVQSIVINDILMASDDYENSNLQQLSFHSNNKENEEKSFEVLSSVEPLHFDSVDTLEIPSVTNESIELEDVSRINVPILDIHESQQSIKNGILPNESRDFDSSTTNFHDDLGNPSSELQCSMPPHSQELPSDSSVPQESSKKIEMVETLSQQPASENPLPLKSPTFSNLPVILQPMKRDRWIFATPLQSPSESSIDPVIHSLAVNNAVSEESDPPITHEIDIIVPPDDEENKNLAISKPLTYPAEKLDQELSTISVDIDGKAVHYKYLMYFEPTPDKN